MINTFGAAVAQGVGECAAAHSRTDDGDVGFYNIGCVGENLRLQLRDSGGHQGAPLG